jgi:hypothetical protein
LRQRHILHCLSFVQGKHHHAERGAESRKEGVISARG